ncbi:MAG: hypothetical protein K2W95_13550 [Candidatus Obscuribacterales bacterium]|nr:hypothetical protein [Candidatus Obscuribacterales bacterium]
MKISPSMFVLLKETIFEAPDGPSRFLHDDVPSMNKSLGTASPELPKKAVK